MLTAQQKRLLDYLRAELESGFAPSLAEMATAMGLSGTGNVHRMLVTLEERGYIRRLFNRARAIEIIDRSSRFCYLDRPDGVRVPLRFVAVFPPLSIFPARVGL
jgi:repressor LexA